MNEERKYTVKFENINGLKLRMLRESLKKMLHTIYSDDPYLIDENELRAIKELIEIMQPVWDEYEVHQKGRNDEYELYLRLKAKFEDREKSANDEPPKELRGHNWRDSFEFK